MPHQLNFILSHVELEPKCKLFGSKISISTNMNAQPQETCISKDDSEDTIEVDEADESEFHRC